MKVNVLPTLTLDSNARVWIFGINSGTRLSGWYVRDMSAVKEEVSTWLSWMVFPHWSRMLTKTNFRSPTNPADVPVPVTADAEGRGGPGRLITFSGSSLMGMRLT
eukprot:1656149-Rhodomonas_salina.2